MSETKRDFVIFDVPFIQRIFVERGQQVSKEQAQEILGLIYEDICDILKYTVWNTGPVLTKHRIDYPSQYDGRVWIMFTAENVQNMARANGQEISLEEAQKILDSLAERILLGMSRVGMDIVEEYFGNTGE